MTKSRDKKKLTRGEKWLLVAPLFFAALLFGVIWFRPKTKTIEPFLIIQNKSHRYSVVCAELSSDGKNVAVLWRSNSAGIFLNVYDTYDGSLRFSFACPAILARDGSISISPNSEWVAVSGNFLDNYGISTRIWNLNTGIELPKRHTTDSGSLAFSPDSTMLALGGQSDDGAPLSLRLWNFQTNSPPQILKNK